MIRSVLAPNPAPFTLDGTRSWLVGETLMIDPGPAIDTHVEALLETQPRVATILVTHRHADHAPAAAFVAARSGARILAPEGVLDDAIVAERLTDGATIECEGFVITAVATPGHTAEHFCFLTDGGDLFTGDTILGEGTTAIFPPDGVMADYMASLRKLRALQPRAIYPGHGPVRSDAVAWIDYYIAHREERERQILEELAEGPLGVAELRARIYPELQAGLRSAAEMQLLAHARHLADRGLVVPNGARLSLVR
ncbi:MAG: MBL fold metallo-hydrolase [Acidobacteria bacterium]|nr:MBL fold metallo-hydrolase [Acidobacteriota bacterium]